ncbi:MAG: hypothetical protein JJ899_09105 [Alphaproteobacteria bacterium]|nr:hypothetical protein [Alphaproteobacteria bacterium]
MGAIVFSLGIPAGYGPRDGTDLSGRAQIADAAITGSWLASGARAPNSRSMINRSRSRTMARAALLAAAFTLAACATAPSGQGTGGDRDSLNRYDRQILDQLGGA